MAVCSARVHAQKNSCPQFLATVRGAVTSLPECWDTRRDGTNEGYFDFQDFAFCVHAESC
jgi:hypothetical protein